MKTVSLCPFPVLPLLWQGKDGLLSLTVLVKATLRMVHGQEAAVAGAQEAIGGDRTWPDDPRGGLLAPTDWVPQKPRADLMLVGHAYAPNGTAVEKLVARLELDDFTKALRITGDRVWVEGGGALVAGRPARFLEMPLRDDLLPAGPGNPCGVQAGASPVEGARAMPNLEPARPGAPATGFGPVSPGVRGHGSDAGFEWAYRLSGPPPEGFDFAFFNAAPPDQQLDRIPAGGSLRLEHLSREFSILETRLPDLRPRAFVARAGAGAPREVALRCDTLLIDADRGLAVLSFRGTLPVEAADWDEGTLGVALEEPDGPSVASRLAPMLGAGPAQEVAPAREELREEPTDLGAPPWPPMHEDERPVDSERTRVRAFPVVAGGPPEPFVAAPLIDEATAADDGDDFARRTAEHGLVDSVRPGAARPVLPFVQAVSPLAASSSEPRPETDHEDLTRDLDLREIRRSATPFRAPSGPSQDAPPISVMPRDLPEQSGETIEIRTRPKPPVAAPPAPSEPHLLRFPPAPPLGPTPGRFVTTSSPAPPSPVMVPRAPAHVSPPSSSGMGIPKLPPIPGKRDRSGG